MSPCQKEQDCRIDDDDDSIPYTIMMMGTIGFANKVIEIQFTYYLHSYENKICRCQELASKCVNEQEKKEMQIKPNFTAFGPDDCEEARGLGKVLNFYLIREEYVPSPVHEMKTQNETLMKSHL